VDASRQPDVVIDEAENPSSNTSRKWTLTPEAFDKLLAVFDPDRDTAAKKYLAVRANLLRFFEWRGCPFPEDHADETFNRVARKVAEGEDIRNVAGYVMGVARLQVLEIIKSDSRQREALGEYQKSFNEVAEIPESESRIDCLQKCLQQLSPDNRELIIQYYQGDKGEKIENRKKLGVRLGVAMNTLRMRAQRLREQLQGCVEECVSAA
jgi:DNA-directed RNA polymerase specialized sigma24 family protein